MNKHTTTHAVAAVLVLIAGNVAAEPDKKQQDPVHAFATRENCQTFLGINTEQGEGLTPQYTMALTKAITALGGPGPVKTQTLEQLGAVCKKTVT